MAHTTLFIIDLLFYLSGKICSHSFSVYTVGLGISHVEIVDQMVCFFLGQENECLYIQIVFDNCLCGLKIKRSHFDA